MAADASSPHDRSRVVRRYLSALDAKKPGRTTQKTAETVLLRMHQVDVELLSADPVERLHLTQERIDLHAEHLRLTTNSGGDFAELEAAFTRVARSYGDKHGITYSAWRQCGVDTAVLAKAGIRQNKPPRAQPADATPADAAPADAAPAEAPVVEPVAVEAAKAAAKEAAPAKKVTATKVSPNGKKAAKAPSPAEAHLLG